MCPVHIENRKFYINMNDFTRSAYILISFPPAFSLWKTTPFEFQIFLDPKGWLYITASTVEEGMKVLCVSSIFSEARIEQKSETKWAR